MEISITCVVFLAVVICASGFKHRPENGEPNKKVASKGDEPKANHDALDEKDERCYNYYPPSGAPGTYYRRTNSGGSGTSRTPVLSRMSALELLSLLMGVPPASRQSGGRTNQRGSSDGSVDGNGNTRRGDGDTGREGANGGVNQGSGNGSGANQGNGGGANGGMAREPDQLFEGGANRERDQGRQSQNGQMAKQEEPQTFN